MNAPAPAAALVAPTVELVAIAALVPSTTHIQELRRSRFDQRLIAELAESVKSVGVLQPILVRRSQANGRADRFEIVAGERRWLAAKKAGLDQIQAAIRDLSDEQVLEVQLIENLQREDLHELEEAEGYEELMKLKSISADAVADMVGRSKSYVFKRTKLLALCPDGRKAFYAGDMDASTALLIARIPGAEFQKRAMKELAQQREWGDVHNFKEASEFLRDNFMLRLKEAPFDRGDATLVPGAGSCVDCPKRTGNQKDLFGDVKDAELCTDAKCFDGKRQAHFSIARLRIEEGGKKVINGDAAKKLLPNWEENNDFLVGGYHKLTDHVGSRKVADVVGKEYEPVLIQHPGTGKIIQAASAQAIAKSTGGKAPKERSSSGAYNYDAAEHRSKAAGPDVDEMLTDRLARPAAVAPARPEEVPPMDKKPLSERIVDALRGGELDLDALATRAGTTKATLYTMMGTLKKKFGVVAVRRGVYALGASPAVGTPPQRVVKKKRAVTHRARRAPYKVRKGKLRATPLSEPPAPTIANGDAQYAINEQGELGIEKGDTKVRLEIREFARLREFIDRTASVWKGASA